jgi:2,4-dienoyl-CoA reductase-like NADH-dependent reductase (Old Yellow Enzyme family)
MQDTARRPAMPLLFQPKTIRGVTLKNRLVVSPMVHFRSKDGKCLDFHVAHLGKFALGGFGLVFTEATGVTPGGRVTEFDLGLWSDEQIDGYKPMLSVLKAEGVASAVQLAHSGRKGGMQTAMEGNGPVTAAERARGRQTWEPVGPTATPVAEGWPVPRQLSASDIADLVDAWAAAAKRAVAAGFDIVEIHAAHGYLLASFLSPVSNTRNDRYGGDIKGRMRFPLEVAEAVRAAIPDTMPLFLRASCVDGTGEGWGMDDTVAFAKELEARGVDVLDCSSGGLTGSATAAAVTRAPGFQVPFAARAKAEAGIDTMAVGLILSPEQAEAILQEGKADLIAIGRQAQYNPNLALHWAHAMGINDRFELWAPAYGWWLDKRVRTMQGFATPTGDLLEGALDRA